MIKAIDLIGNLELVSESSSITVTATGEELNCRINGDLINTFRNLFKQNLLNFLQKTKFVDKELKQLGLVCNVIVQDRMLFKIGTGTKRTLIPSLIGSESELSLRNFLFILGLYVKSLSAKK